MNLYGKIEKEALNHKTEIDLDNEYFDFVIDANKDIEKVKQYYRQMKCLKS